VTVGPITASAMFTFYDISHEVPFSAGLKDAKRKFIFRRELDNLMLLAKHLNYMLISFFMLDLDSVK
jgi:hypothetical protein